MNKKEEKEIQDLIKKEMKELSIKSISDGFKACASAVKNGIHDGNKIEDVVKYCDWVLKTNNVVVESINNKKKIAKNEDN